MKKFYRIFLLIITLIFLTTFNPRNFDTISKKNDQLFEIKNIEIKNSFLIDENEVMQKLTSIYKKNIFFVNRLDIEEPLKGINFFEKVEVKKKYPNSRVFR